MPRKRPRKVLYELSTEARKAREPGPKVEIYKRLRAFTNKVQSKRKIKKVEKPSLTRLNESKRSVLIILGRIFNFSIKKALVLLVVTAVIVVLWPSGDVEVPGSQEGVLVDDGEAAVVETPIVDDLEVGPRIPGPPKDHIIVIASHKDAEQLKVLASYFAVKGIETEFRVSGNRQTLITKDRYMRVPGDPQSRIKQAKEKIKEIGNEYEPPSGFLLFKFNDIYEQKIQ